jgi:hypothetical protein
MVVAAASSSILCMSYQLQEWASQGAPVDCRNGWSMEAIMMAIQARPSPTALTPEVKALVEEALQYKVKAGITEIVWVDELLHNLLRNLKISRVAAIPQKNRCDCLTLNLSEGVWSQDQR